MSDSMLTTLSVFAVIASPAAIASFAAFAPTVDAARIQLLALVFGLVLGTLAIAIFISDPFLDWLSVSGESFQTAAGLVMLPLAARLLWSGQRPEAPASSSFWRATSLVLGPASAVIALSYSARFGVATALGASALAVLLSAALLMVSPWLACRVPAAALSLLGRFNGALIVILAVELIVDGVQSV
jgi:multiple antibiotic resistance protein